MDACQAVERELEKVVSRFTHISEKERKSIDDLSKKWMALYSLLDINGGPEATLTPSQVQSVRDLSAKTRDSIQKLASEHRDLHGSVSKVGKAIDRNFTADYTGATCDFALCGTDKERLLNEAICEHFFRHGLLHLGDSLAEESGLGSLEAKKSPFVELNLVVQALRERNVEPALEWCRRHEDSLKGRGSSLEFKLHKLRFMELLSSPRPVNPLEAVLYARRHFTPFADQHEVEIQHLMGALMYISDGLDSSPYASLLDPVSWMEVADLFSKEACALLGLSLESPLSVCVNAGCIALPALLNIKQVIQNRLAAGGVWAHNEELPIKIDLGPEYRYHSIFACPILRQQTTDANPPMRLTCGHCISRDALTKLSHGTRLKCPYCPEEQNPSDARLLYF